MSAELIINHGGVSGSYFSPALEGEVTVQTERKGFPGTIKFKTVIDSMNVFEEGDAVRFCENGDKVFYGFIFTKEKNRESFWECTAYDQTRYFKNSDTYNFVNKKAGDIVSIFAADFRLQTGIIEDTQYVIPSLKEQDKTLFDIVGDALDKTIMNTKQMYVLYDDFGKLNLKNISNMMLDVLIDEETGQNYKYRSSIDESTYNRIKLRYEDNEKGITQIYIAQSGENMNRWGVLQKTDTVSKNENGQAKADALLALYNKKTRKLSIEKAFGVNAVRAGCMLPVILDLVDTKVCSMMLVDKCKHTYSNGEHWMDLTLRGGEFIV